MKSEPPRERMPSMAIALNVGLAIVTSGLLAWKGEPAVAWPICMMVTAVYGIPNPLKLLQLWGLPR